MLKIKKCFKLTALASGLTTLVLLSACGGGQADRLIAAPDQKIQKQSAWVALGDQSQINSDTSTTSIPRLLASNFSTPTLINDDIKNSVDGIYLNIDSLPSNWEDQTKSALTAGQVVVLVTTDKTNGPALMHDITLGLSGIGVKAAAVMLYKGEENNDSTGLLPFNFDELDQLAELMTSVVRRKNLEPTVSKINKN